VTLTGAQVNIADRDAATTRFEHRRWRTAIGSWYFQLRRLADSRGFADTLAANERDVVVSPQDEARSVLNIIDVFGQTTLESVPNVGMAPERHQFSADNLRVPKKVLIRVIERRTRNFAPFPPQRLRKLERLGRANGFGNSGELV